LGRREKSAGTVVSAGDDGLERLGVDGRLDRLERVIGLEDGGRADEGLLIGLHVGDDPFLHLREGGLELALRFLPAGVEVLLVSGAERLGMLDEDLARALVGADDLVEVGLGEERLVALVVAVAAVADDVDDDVAAELPARKSMAMRAASATAIGSSPFTWRTGASIDLGDVGAVEGGAGVAWAGW